MYLTCTVPVSHCVQIVLLEEHLQSTFCFVEFNTSVTRQLCAYDLFLFASWEHEFYITEAVRPADVSSVGSMTSRCFKELIITDLSLLIPVVFHKRFRGSCPPVCYVDTPQNTVIHTSPSWKLRSLYLYLLVWHQTLLHITHRLARKDTALDAFPSVCLRRLYVNENVCSWEGTTTMACMLNRVYRCVSFQLWILFRRGSVCMVLETMYLKLVLDRGEQTPGVTSPGCLLFFFTLAPCICGSLVCNFLRVTLLWCLDFWGFF
jgi:hypothetical protein